MKKFLILLIYVIACSVLISNAYATGKNKQAGKDELLRKSTLFEPPSFGPHQTSYPWPFDPVADPYAKTNPAISTGYFFVDNHEGIAPWQPLSNVVDTNFKSNLWRRVLPGPHLQPAGYWPHEGGYAFFRSWKTYSGAPITGTWFDYVGGLPNECDSTDNAFAGPIPIGFDFYFNGVRCDSFYVGSHGIIALSNRRYTYNTLGQRTPTPGGNCYDVQSMDWFVGPTPPAGYPDRVTSRSLTICNSEDGTADPINDDFGYNVAVYNWGLSHTGSTNGTILQAGGTLENLNTKLPVIAPFFGSVQLSQYNPGALKAEDWGKVYYYKSITGDTLIVYFVNAALYGTQWTPYGNTNISRNRRNFDGSQSYNAANAQICLARTDSSVTITYEKFDGYMYMYGATFRPEYMFEWNTTCGVRGFARHSNFDSKDPSAPVPALCTGNPYYPWTSEYQQSTVYYDKYHDWPFPSFPSSGTAVRFKQWKNVLRVIGIKFMLRPEVPETDPSYTDNFIDELSADNVLDKELLAGHRQLGAIQPVAIIQNLTNDIQGPNGVNYQPQDLEFRARFMINNMATLMTIYNRSVPINNNCLLLPDPDPDNLCSGVPNVKVRYVQVTNFTTLATSLNPYPGPNNLHGIPPYGYVEVFFPPFVPNPLFENHIGRMQGRIIGEPRYFDPLLRQYVDLGDEWPFDDTLSTRFFVMKRIPNDVVFKDDVTEYHVVQDISGGPTPMPSVLKWVSFQADVVNGNNISQHPLPPRGLFKADNARMSGDSTLYRNFYMESPTIKLDRNVYPPGVMNDGDQIRSYPIDVTSKLGAVLSISIQRTSYVSEWDRGFCDAQLIGCEQRVIVGGDWATTTNVGSADADKISVQYAPPSPDGVKGICWLHGSDLSWNQLLQDNGGSVSWSDGMAGALRLFGGGGYVVGYDENNYNHAYPMAFNPGTREKFGLRDNVYDDGIDFEFQKFIMTIPDAYINSPNNGAYNFRFRVKVYANDNRIYGSIPGIPDDNDEFFVDNIRILTPCEECVDIECNSVNVIWPYTIIPASQAIALPIKVKISNNTGNSAPAFYVKVRIYYMLSPTQMDTKPVYCRSVSMWGLRAGTITEVPFPTWNARKSPPGDYRIYANVYIPYAGGDLEPLNDTTYYDFHLVYGDHYQYDPELHKVNDVPGPLFGNIDGRGLDSYGFSMGGGRYTGLTLNDNDNVYYTREWEAGRETGSGSGQFAMKFELYQADTLFGYEAFFGPLSQAPDATMLSVYNGVTLPSGLVEGTDIMKTRGYDDIRQKSFWNEYVTYLLPNPVYLPAGSYWMTISQQGETGLELGASQARMAMRNMDTYTSNPPGYGQFQNGSGSIYMLADKNLRTETRDPNVKLNLNLFAYENTKGSNTWYPFMNTQGNPGFGHLDYIGEILSGSVSSGVYTITPTYTRGTWLPMMAPYFGDRSYGTTLQYDSCSDVPVELTYFDGQVRQSGIDLFWETASEVKNYGFNVERTLASDNGISQWKTVGFVKGHGSTNSLNRYGYFDNDVQIGKTYSYRLRQIDEDGTQNCGNFSNVVTLTFDQVGSVTLEQNYPNPFNYSTMIHFSLADNTSDATLQVLDIYGSVVKTLINNEIPKQNFVVWDGFDNNGNKVSSGTYIYRLISGDEIRTGKMTLVR